MLVARQDGEHGIAERKKAAVPAMRRVVESDGEAVVKS
jgi:hypothetical protein